MSRSYTSVWLLLLLVMGCRKDRGAEVPTGVIKIDGSSTVFPIAESITAGFMSEHAGVDVRVGISGTSGGIAKLCQGTVDLADASRPMTSEEAERCRRRGVEFVELPIGFDGLAVVVNNKNDWAAHVTVTELRRMWESPSQHRVRRWSDVRPGWPERDLHLYGADTASGTYDYFVEAVGATGRTTRTDYTSSEDDNVIAQAVANDELSIGFFGYAYWLENRDRLKLLGVDDERDDNGHGATLPTPETIQEGAYQPLSRPLFVYVARASLDRPEVDSFTRYLLDAAPRTVEAIGYIRLPTDVYAAIAERLRERRTGSLLAARRSAVGISTKDLIRGP